MARRKTPAGLIKVCPTNCSGGYADNQRAINEGQAKFMPADVLEAAKNGLRYCIYCHAVYEDRGGYKKLYGRLENEFERYKGF